MKSFVLVGLLGMLAFPSLAAELNWLTDLSKAQAQAKTDNKMVLLNFTGSDWCYWSKRLRQELFATAEFAAFAKDNLVLVEVDFPRTKPQSAELKRANAALKQTYATRDGFPTIVVIKSDPKGEWKAVWKQVGAKLPEESSRPARSPADVKLWIKKLAEAKGN